MRERIKAEACMAANSAILCPTTVRFCNSKASADARRSRERVYSGHVDARDPSSRALARQTPRPSVACGVRGFRDLTAGGKDLRQLEAKAICESG